MAKTLSRSSTASRIFNRSFSTSTFRSVLPSLLTSNIKSHRASSPSSLFHLVGFNAAALNRFTAIRIPKDRSGVTAYLYAYAYEYTYKSESDDYEYESKSDDEPLPGQDFKHWGVHMDARDKPGGENPTKQQLIDCYVKTLAKIVGSEEEAKRKIYNISCDGWFGFGCEIDSETATKVYELEEVWFVFADSYVHPEIKDYGSELFVNGEIVPRAPEIEKKIHDYVMRAVNYWSGSEGDWSGSEED